MKWFSTVALAFLASGFLAGCRPTGALPTPAVLATVPSQAFQRDLVPTPPQATPTAVADTLPTPTPDPPTPVPTPPAAEAWPTLPPTPQNTPEPPATAEPACDTPGRIVSGTLDSAVAGETMRYRVYLPPCYGQDGYVYPALYMFGGNIHDDGIWDALGLDEAAEAAIAAGTIPPLIIVMPDNGWLANTTTSGPGSYESFVLNELIPHIESQFCAWADPAGRAVGGLSRGGYWSLMMAFRRADLFRSAGGHSPALIDSFAGPAEDPAQTAATNDLGDLRIWVDIGERDPYIVQARPVHDALTNRSIPHEWRVNPGTHEEAYWRENLASYLAWYSDGWRVAREMLPGCEVAPSSD